MNSVDKLRKSLLEFLDDLFPDKIELFVSYLLKSSSFHVNYESDLINNVTHSLLAPIELLSPSVFHLPDDELGDVLQSRVLEQVVHLDLAGVDDPDWSTLFIDLVEASGHELPDSVLLTHEVMVQEHVHLEPMSPL